MIGFVGCEPFRGEMTPNIESASEHYASGWYKALYRTAISVEATLYFHRTEDSRDGDIDIDEASVSEELYDGSRSLHAETYLSSVTKNQIYAIQNVSKRTPGLPAGSVHGSAHSGGARYPGLLRIWHHSSVTLSWCTAMSTGSEWLERILNGEVFVDILSLGSATSLARRVREASFMRLHGKRVNKEDTSQEKSEQDETSSDERH
ncbi:hypothetical protein ARMGADRAFT_1022035 [Armillaria gallica]|uniref:Uncharacterized protein n=1 Tax=Armillaria gallica TaxID=47427 RepID=A0A2H3EJ35_ARMGA|nr:hypothetical protein ARMGADRAFT_1022035 [Armillaria gallica]